MTGNNILLASIAGITVFLIYMAIMQLVNRPNNVRDRMRRIAGEDIRTESNFDPLVMDHERSALASFLDQILRAVGVNTEAYRKAIQLKFYRAGVQSPDAPIYYLFFKRIVIIAVLIVAALLFFNDQTGKMRFAYYGIGVFLVIAGFFGADIFLSNERAKRQKILQRSFPDALDLLLVCVESGLALDGALARVCRELGRAHPEMTQELNRTRLELTMLNDRTQALANLAERTDMLAFRSLVTTLMQSERFGTNLTETLRVLSDDYRHTRLMLAEQKAGRLPALITIPLILLMMPAFFLVILGPAALKLVIAAHSP